MGKTNQPSDLMMMLYNDPNVNPNLKDAVKDNDKNNKYYLLKFYMDNPSHDEYGTETRGHIIISEDEFNFINNNLDLEICIDDFEDCYDEEEEYCDVLGGMESVKDYLNACTIYPVTEEDYNVFKKYDLVNYGDHMFYDVVELIEKTLKENQNEDNWN